MILFDSIPEVKMTLMGFIPIETLQILLKGPLNLTMRLLTIMSIPLIHSIMA